MQIIQHRINTCEQLKSTDQKFGVEIDVRYHNDEIVLHHDPFHHHQSPAPEKFETFLSKYKNEGVLIVNIKTEGIEKECIELLNRHQIKTWFFLDLSMPYFVKYALAGSRNEIEGFSKENLAVRFSEYEPIEYALEFRDKARWIWVDCFEKCPLDSSVYSLIKDHFKVCLVSPELQKHPKEKIQEFKAQLKDIQIDAVCTKYPEEWLK